MWKIHITQFYVLILVLAYKIRHLTFDKLFFIFSLHQEIFLYADLQVSAPKNLWVSVPPSMVCEPCKSLEILIITKISGDLLLRRPSKRVQIPRDWYTADIQRFIYCTDL